MHVLGIIPARGGSKGIPKKNIYPLLGKPLIGYTIEAALGSRVLTRTILSTDSEEIAETARGFGLEVPFMRPAELADDASPALPYIEHALERLRGDEGYVPGYIALLQPTSPLRTSRHIDQCMQTLMDSDADSIVTVVQAPHNCIPQSIMELKDGFLKPFLAYDERDNQRQKKPVYYARNGAAVYGFTHDCLTKKKSVFGDRILPFVMAPEDSVDIDTMLDMRIAECLLSNRTEVS